MTLDTLISRSIDRIQDICLVDYPIDGPDQRKQLRLVLFDLLMAAPKVVIPVVGAEAIVADNIAPLLYRTRGANGKAKFRERYRFLVLPDDLTIPANLDAKGELVVP